MPQGRAEVAASAVDGKVYVIGGTPKSHPLITTSTVYEYDTGFVPPEESTSVEPKGKLAMTRGGHQTRYVKS